MTQERLAEIEARAEAATPGPWEMRDKGILSSPEFEAYVATHEYAGVTDFPNAWGGGVANCIGSSRHPKKHETNLRAASNANFIAHARTDIPDLIAEVKRLREIVGDFEIATEGWREDNQG